MKFIKVKTRVMRPPKDDIYQVIDQSLPKLREGDILVITSKVLAIHQGRCVKIRDGSDQEKNRLIMTEAERFIPSKKTAYGHVHLTIKNHTFIADAGIDKSNGNGYYILWPRNLQKLIREIRQYLKKRFKLKKLGVIVVDSHLIPMRAGIVGIAVGFYGLHPLIDYRGQPDIFGRKLEVTRSNIVDSLAAISVLLMGEGNEQTPILIIRSANFIRFTDKNTYKQLIFPLAEDIFYPILKAYRRNKRFDKKTKLQ
jgi:coenzyme F420-0:L-glutamate ligase